MSKNLRRLIFSFCVSALCVGLVQIWYGSQKTSSDSHTNDQPIARLIEATAEVQRRPLKRLIWQTVTENDSLFAGEQIRTAPHSEAKIEILKTHAILSLEPQSLIVLEESDGNLSLDFLEGNLFVQNTGTNNQLKVRSGKQEINLTGAEASLGRQKGSDLSLQVFKGQVQGAAVHQDEFKILKPLPYAEIFVQPGKKEPIAWDWQAKLPVGTDVFLNLGKDRNSLTRMNLQKSFQGGSVQLPIGDHYWQLEAWDAKKNVSVLKSSIYKIRVLAKQSMIPVRPEDNDDLSVLNSQESIRFEWGNPGRLQNARIQVSLNPQFTSPLIDQAVAGDRFQVPIEKPGVYFWRVGGELGKAKEQVFSSPRQFKLSINSELVAPRLETPIANDRMTALGVQEKGVSMKWKAVGGAENYLLRLKKLGAASFIPLEETTQIPRWSTKDLQSGEYEWDVLALGASGKKSPPSPARRFKIEDLPLLTWKKNESPQVLSYWGEAPDAFFEWNTGPKGSARYRVSLRSDESGEAISEEVPVRMTEFKKRLSTGGRWIASIEALDLSNRVLAKSSDKIMIMKPAPILMAPRFDPNLGENLTASKRGVLDISWSSIEGAQSYILELRDNRGQIVGSYTSQQNRIYLNKMKPGQFKLSVHGIDQAGRSGLVSAEKNINVPELSDVRAPKMMKVQVQ